MTISQAQKDPGILQTVSLLTAYCFDLRGGSPVQVISNWLKDFSALWIRLAVIEALYLGRYKAVSVEHLLEHWQKKGQPNFHFSAEFERMVSRNLPRSLANHGGGSLAIATDEQIEELARGVDQPWPLKVPPVAQKLLPRRFKESAPQEKNPWARPSYQQGKQTATEPVDAPITRSPGPAPSIEQFIPITQESDLLSRLQSVLVQETENV